MFCFRQHKAVADVLHCNDDNHSVSFCFLFSEGEARRSLRSEVNTVRECTLGTRYVQLARAHMTFGISTWNGFEHDSMLN
jgi:hypothetical protein